MLRLGANPIVLAKMKDGTSMLVDLRTNTEVDAFYKGKYDPVLIDCIRRLLGAESYFLDIGANVGFYTVAIATTLKAKGGSGKVIAFEPFKGNYKRPALSNWNDQ